MSDRIIQFDERRVLLFGSIGNLTGDALRHPFAALVSAYNEQERDAAIRMIPELLRKGCVEFCCVGPEADQLHDSIDWILEDSEEFAVTTTAHEDVVDGCEYFMYAAAGKPNALLVIDFSHAEISASLMRILSNCRQ